MTPAEFEAALSLAAPPDGLSAPLAALWWDANYWYARAGERFRRPSLDAEWRALVEGLLG
jgi:hypothetical protein